LGILGRQAFLATVTTHYCSKLFLAL